MKTLSLTKTTFMEGIRCLKLLWLRVNRPELAELVDGATQHLFNVGHRVEVIAHQLFPGGIKVGNGSPMARGIVLEKTATAIMGKAPFIYEAGFQYNNCYCRADILERLDNCNCWNLGEVKMCTKVKPEHPIDCAFQTYCIEQSGNNIDNVYLVHVNSGYEFTGEINPGQFLVAADITAETQKELLNIPSRIDKFKKLLGGECPDVLVDGHCKEPGRCSFYKVCHADIPAGSIHELPYGKSLIPSLIESGITLLKDIPNGISLSTRQSALVKSATAGKPVINAHAINSFLSTIKHPAFYLDFETTSPCIPLLNNSRPYEKIPFQFSLHVQNKPKAGLQHYHYLPEQACDPRISLLEELLPLLGSHGSIITWNSSFEISVLKGLAKRFPQYSGSLNSIIDRIFDLIVPFRSGAYSDVRFAGSASLKKVLPVLVSSLTYTGMAISKGDDASLSYELFLEGKTLPEEWESIRNDLLVYCKLDTLAMVEIHEVLKKACE